MLKSSFSKKIEAGCDEAGRGCLSGPVVAASVILPKKFKHPLLNDSKQLTEKNRILLEKVIKKEATCWEIGVVWNKEIDKIKDQGGQTVIKQMIIAFAPMHGK